MRIDLHIKTIVMINLLFNKAKNLFVFFSSQIVFYSEYY